MLIAVHTREDVEPHVFQEPHLPVCSCLQRRNVSAVDGWQQFRFQHFQSIDVCRRWIVKLSLDGNELNTQFVVLGLGMLNVLPHLHELVELRLFS